MKVTKPEVTKRIRYKDSQTGRWVTEEVVQIEDLRPHYDVTYFVTNKGHRVRPEFCIERTFPEDGPEEGVLL